MKKRKPIDAAKMESEIKKDYYVCCPAPSEIMYGPEGQAGLGCPALGLVAKKLSSGAES